MWYVLVNHSKETKTRVFLLSSSFSLDAACEPWQPDRSSPWYQAYSGKRDKVLRGLATAPLSDPRERDLGARKQSLAGKLVQHVMIVQPFSASLWVGLNTKSSGLVGCSQRWGTSTVCTWKTLTPSYQGTWASCCGATPASPRGWCAIVYSKPRRSVQHLHVLGTPLDLEHGSLQEDRNETALSAYFSATQTSTSAVYCTPVA